MLGRNLDAYGEYKSVYVSVSTEAEEEFKSKVGSLTVFHKILIDRVADSYVSVLKASEAGELGADSKASASESLTRWLKVALGELHSSSVEGQRMLLFYDKVVEIVEKTVVDIHGRKELLIQVRKLVEEGV